MPSAHHTLLPLLTAFLSFSSVWAYPSESSVLSIPVRDIIENDLSAHEAHPNFELYSRWLETAQGSYIGRNPEAAFTKHSNIVAIDCHSHTATCFFTSRVPFADITNSKRDLDALNSALVARLQAGDKDEPMPLFARTIEDYSGIEKRSDLEKRWGNTYSLYSSTHLKTYHKIGDNPAAGFQHYITWDLKCKTLQFSSSGFQLTSKRVSDYYTGLATQLFATLVGDQDPASTHSVEIFINFACGLFTNKCCVNAFQTHNYLGGVLVVTPKSEPIECVAAKDVSNQNCDTFDPGWCGVHITQYQKNEGPGLNTENYRFDVILYDAKQELVGELDLLSVPSGQTTQVGSTLPYTFGITAPDTDEDAVYMSYSDQSWGSNDQAHHCNFGAYDSGTRNGDCGFSC